MTGGLIFTETFRVESGASAIVSDETNPAIFDTVGVEVMGTLDMNHGQVTATSLTVTPGGRLEIGMGGLDPYFDFAKLDMTGTATLAGTLELSLIDSFVPAIGDSFDILTYSSLVGAFEQVNGMDLGNGSYLALIYGANSSTVRVQLGGDLNNDGFVGIEDLNMILGVWNQTVPAGSPMNGDITGDGFVGIEDLNQVLGNWNAGTPPPAEALAMIPEPGTLGVLALGLGLLGRGRRGGMLAF